jgi:TetR/AcrR family fatty acid metabolism transcriptional regulator
MEQSIHCRILEAAKQEFSQKGFHQTVVSDIADRAKVGKGTVYRHFGNKNDLFGRLIREGMDFLEQRIHEALSRGASPIETLEEILDVHFDFFENSRELIDIVIMEGLQRIGQVREELVQELSRIRTLLRQLFETGMEQKVFRKQDPDKLAVLLQGYIWSVLRGAVIYELAHPRAMYRDLMQETFLLGILESTQAADRRD